MLDVDVRIDTEAELRPLTCRAVAPHRSQFIPLEGNVASLALACLVPGWPSNAHYSGTAVHV